MTDERDIFHVNRTRETEHRCDLVGQTKEGTLIFARLPVTAGLCEPENALAAPAGSQWSKVNSSSTPHALRLCSFRREGVGFTECTRTSLNAEFHNGAGEGEMSDRIIAPALQQQTTFTGVISNFCFKTGCTSGKILSY